MKFKKVTYLVAVVTSLAILLTACGGQPSSSESTPSSSESTPSSSESTPAVFSDELNVAVTANPPTLDTHGSSSNVVCAIGYHIYEPLFAMNADYQPTPVLAESYEVSGDGLVYTINIRQGIKFHNGQTLIADDVVASMDHWIASSGKAKALISGTVFSKVDDSTISMELTHAYSDALIVLASSAEFAAIYPKSVLDAATETGVSEYIGTGPYKLVEWKQDQYVELTRYTDYKPTTDEQGGLSGKKLAATETLYFRVVPDNATRVAGLKTGEYDVIELVPTEYYDELSVNEDIVLTVKNAGSSNLFLNTTEGILANETMRQAVLAALNCSDIMTATYGNPDLYTISPSWMDPNNATWGSEAGVEYYNQNNVEKAQALLAEAGYNNEPVVLITTQDYIAMYNATLVVCEQLCQAGINAQVESYDFSTFYDHRGSTNLFDLFITTNRYIVTPIQLLVLTKDWAGLDRPEVTDGLSAIRSAATTEQASAAWDDLQTFLYEYGAATVLGHYTAISAARADVEGFYFFDFPLYWDAKVPE